MLYLQLTLPTAPADGHSAAWGPDPTGARLCEWQGLHLLHCDPDLDSETSFVLSQALLRYRYRDSLLAE